MSGLPYKDRMNALCGEPIEVKGITLYPIRLMDMGEYDGCKSVLEIRQSTLPVSYISMPYLEALFAMDRDNQFKLGLMARVIKLISLSTRADVRSFRLFGKDGSETELGRITFTAGEEEKEITPKNYGAIRNAIAFLNREELPDESENAELVEAQQDIAMVNDLGLDLNMDTLLESVAAMYRIRIRDMMEWTVRDFRGIAEALDREKRYMLMTGAEFSGNIKWQRGNPCPSWQFDKKKTAGGVLEPIAEAAGHFGLKNKE